MPVPYRGNVVASLDDIDLRGKKVLVRFDLNSPVKEGSIIDDTRIRASAPSLRKLVEEGAAVVIMSHQGRPLEGDFTSLEEHAALLSKFSGIEVEFIPDVIGPEALRRIKSLSPGEVLLLDNTRLISEDYIEAHPDVHAEGFMVTRLAPLFDYYVNDAFSVSHRSQASVVGFPLKLPSAAGPLLESELMALDRALRGSRPLAVFLGGAKLKDAVAIIEELAHGGADWILAGGLVGVMVSIAQGAEMPQQVVELVERKAGDGWRRRLSRLIEEGAPLESPVDYRVELDDGRIIVQAASHVTGTPKDIGPETVEIYSSIFAKARAIVMRGPAGVIEDPRFREGTLRLVEAALSGDAYTLFGGGHFNAVISGLPEGLRDRVGHVSTGGGALLYFLAGKPLPGLEALVVSARRFNLVEVNA